MAQSLDAASADGVEHASLDLAEADRHQMDDDECAEDDCDILPPGEFQRFVVWRGEEGGVSWEGLGAVPEMLTVHIEARVVL